MGARLKMSVESVQELQEHWDNIKKIKREINQSFKQPNYKINNAKCPYKPGPIPHSKNEFRICPYCRILYQCKVNSYRKTCGDKDCRYKHQLQLNNKRRHKHVRFNGIKLPLDDTHHELIKEHIILYGEKYHTLVHAHMTNRNTILVLEYGNEFGITDVFRWEYDV